MVNASRMVNEFLELVAVDSLSRREREMADLLTGKLLALGLSVREDGAAQAIGGSCGNLICRLPGNTDRPPVLFIAHMDTVVPGEGKRAVLADGVFRSAGDTVLGGDDLSGVVPILEALRVLRENKLPHGDVWVIFTVCEELAVLGSRHLDLAGVDAKLAYILDAGGPVGKVVTRAPAKLQMNATIHGVAAHAGMQPEKGVSAISMASRAIAKMRLGRIDEMTTANIGSIRADGPTNIVSPRLTLQAETRSLLTDRATGQSEHMRECLETELEPGCRLEWDAELSYPAICIDEDAEIVQTVKRAAEAAGLPFSCGQSGGGSDANNVNAKGIPAVALSTGMRDAHTLHESLEAEDLTRAARLVLAIIECIR